MNNLPKPPRPLPQPNSFGKFDLSQRKHSRRDNRTRSPISFFLRGLVGHHYMLRSKGTLEKSKLKLPRGLGCDSRREGGRVL